jgi:hypothetical protein
MSKPFMRTIRFPVRAELVVLATLLLATQWLDDGLQAHATPPPVLCGALVNQNIKLLADVGPCPGDGLIVAANGVSINLNGHKVFATQRLNVGIRLENVSNVSVVGGTVEGFDTGVLLAGGLADTVAFMTVQNNRFGIRVQDAPLSGHQISKNVVTNNRLIGILLSPNVSAATINKNSASRNVGYGIVLDGGSSLNVVNGNSAFDNASQTYIYQPLTSFPDINLRGPNFVEARTNLFPPTFSLVSPSAQAFINEVDYAVLWAGTSSDITARLVPINIVLNPAATSLNNPIAADTSTSGCNPGDFAGFQQGDIALIQRGTCELGIKVLNAYSFGASGVILFNEGQAPSRTAFDFGAVRASTFIDPPNGPPPVIGTSYAIGYALYNLTRAGPVQVRLSAGISSPRSLVILTEGTTNNVITMNSAGSISDDNPVDNCLNQWTKNTFDKANSVCAGLEGTGGGAGGGSTIHSY